MFAGLCMQSCLILPEVPHYVNRLPSRENMDVPLREGFPLVGRSTREEVLSRLGAPDEASEDGARLTYRWRKVVAEMICVFLQEPSQVTSTYGLEIDCDARGVVSRCERK